MYHFYTICILVNKGFGIEGIVTCMFLIYGLYIRIKPKGQSRMATPETLATLGTQNTGRRQTKCFDLIFGVLTPLSAIFQLYSGDQF